MEEAPENGKESPHSVRANGLIETFDLCNRDITHYFRICMAEFCDRSKFA